MAVKRRTIWLSDEEWEVLGQAAKKNGWNISQEIRNLWQYADDAADGKPITLRQQENLITSVWVDPAPNTAEKPFVQFRPAPKISPRRKK